MLAILASITLEDAGQIAGYAVAAAITGVTTWGVCRKQRPHAEAEGKEYVTKEELHKLEDKHDRFEQEMRATLRDSEQRTHKRLDLLSSKMDESIGLQKGNAQIINRLLEHLILPSVGSRPGE